MPIMIGSKNTKLDIGFWVLAFRFHIETHADNDWLEKYETVRDF